MSPIFDYLPLDVDVEKSVKTPLIFRRVRVKKIEKLASKWDILM